MKKLILIALVVSNFAFAALNKKVTATGGSPITTTYNTGSQSLVLTGLTGSIRHVSVFNATSDVIAFTVGHPSPAFAPANDVDDTYLVPNTGFVLDDIGTAAQVFLRSDSGASITSGKVYLKAW